MIRVVHSLRRPKKVDGKKCGEIAKLGRLPYRTVLLRFRIAIPQKRLNRTINQKNAISTY